MKQKLKRLFWKYFDYDIVRTVYDNDGKGHRKARHIRKYKLRKRGKLWS